MSKMETLLLAYPVSIREFCNRYQRDISRLRFPTIKQYLLMVVPFFFVFLLFKLFEFNLSLITMSLIMMRIECIGYIRKHRNQVHFEQVAQVQTVLL